MFKKRRTDIWLLSHVRAKWMPIAACTLLLLGIGVMAANQWLPQSALLSAIENVPDLATTASAKNETKTPQSTRPFAPAEQISAELITITPRGFEPNQITRPVGRVLLVLVNKSEFPMMTLRLERENGPVLRTVELPRNRRRLSIPITLPAGRYRVVDISRPRMVCNIEITP